MVPHLLRQTDYLHLSSVIVHLDNLVKVVFNRQMGLVLVLVFSLYSIFHVYCHLLFKCRIRSKIVANFAGSFNGQFQ